MGTSGAGHVEARVALALAVIVVGVGLLVGSVFGSARALIPIGLLLVALTAVATVSQIPLSGGVGERDWRPVAVGELSRSYRLTAGDAQLDLSALDLGSRTRHVRVAIGMGQLTVVLPAGTPAEVHAHTGMGELLVLGRDENGVDLSRTTLVTGDGRGRLVLDLTLGMGQLDVHTPIHLLEAPR